MKRRNLILGLGTLTAGASAVAGSGAFSLGSVDRNADVAIATEDNAYLAMEPSPGPNGAYATQASGTNEIGLDFSGATSGQNGSGVNSEGEFYFDDVFGIENQATERLYIWTNFSGGSQFDDSNLYLYPNGARSKKLNDGSNSVLTLNPGESANIGVYIDTDSTTTGSSETLQMTIRADVDKPSNSGPVNSGGDDALVVSQNPNPNNDNEFGSIQAAVDAAGGTTIYVESGTYQESVTIEGTSGLTLKGLGDPTVVGEGTGVGSQPYATFHVNGNPATTDITIEGFTIQHPDGHYGIYAGTGGSNSKVDGLEVRGNVIEDIATNLSSYSPLAGAVTGVYARAEWDSLTVEDNIVRNVVTTDGTRASGLSFSSFIGNAAFDDTDTGSKTAKNTEVRNNIVEDISCGEFGRVKGIAVSGEFDGVKIVFNTIDTLSGPVSDSNVYALELTENPGKPGSDFDNDGTNERIGPRNFEIGRNEIDNITGQYPNHLFVGGYEDLGDDHRVFRNNFFDVGAGVQRFAGDQGGFNIGDDDSLDVRKNYWGASDGPSGEDGAGGSGAPAETIGDDASGTDRSGKVLAGEPATAPAGYESNQVGNAGSSL